MTALGTPIDPWGSWSCLASAPGCDIPQSYLRMPLCLAYTFITACMLHLIDDVSSYNSEHIVVTDYAFVFSYALGE